MPHKVAAHAERRADARRSTTVIAAVDWSLGNNALCPYAGYDAVKVCFYHDAADNHLCQCRVHGLKVEDKVELAHIFKKPVERLDIHLNEVNESER